MNTARIRFVPHLQGLSFPCSIENWEWIPRFGQMSNPAAWFVIILSQVLERVLLPRHQVVHWDWRSFHHWKISNGVLRWSHHWNHPPRYPTNCVQAAIILDNNFNCKYLNYQADQERVIDCRSYIKFIDCPRNRGRRFRMPPTKSSKSKIFTKMWASSILQQNSSVKTFYLAPDIISSEYW